MLTSKQIEFATLKEKPYKLADKDGLYLYITPQGGKYWRHNYRHDGKNKTLSYGVFPKVSLLEARQLHKETQDTLLLGADPMLDRTEQKIRDRTSRYTFEYVGEEWFAHWSVDKDKKTVLNVRNWLNNSLYPVWAKKRIKDLTITDIKIYITKIVKRGAYDVAKRSLQRVNQICRYAYIHEYIPHPIAALKPTDLIPKRRSTNHARISEAEIPQLLHDINNYGGAQVTVLAMKFMFLTFVRTSELILATWAEIDFEKKRWVISAERMKMDRPHIVPLSAQSLRVLTQLKRLNPTSTYLFPTTYRVRKDVEKPISNAAILSALYKIGYRGKMTGHGFRGVASTYFYEREYVKEHIELQLAHDEDDRVKAAYNHALYLRQRTQMMQDWADFLESKGDI